MYRELGDWQVDAKRKGWRPANYSKEIYPKHHTGLGKFKAVHLLLYIV